VRLFVLFCNFGINASDAFIPKLQNKTCVDHKDNNRLNNHMNNLRWCTKAENNMNTTKTCGSSKYKGVAWDKKSKKWRAQIECRYEGRRKRFSLGYFKDEDEAGRKYNAKAKELFGEFAKLNVID